MIYDEIDELIFKPIRELKMWQSLAFILLAAVALSTGGFIWEMFKNGC